MKPSARWQKYIPVEVGPVRELRHCLSQLRLENLAVGEDGRARCLLSAFASKTSRNQPSTTSFIFSPATWLRSLIKPAEGQSVAYLDYEQQEFGIGAALAEDDRMQQAYRSGDPYLTFAKQAGAVPLSATKHTHASERDRFKTLALGVQYGMQVEALARRLNTSLAHAGVLLDLHRETYRKYWRWSEAVQNYAMLHGSLQSVFGWTLHVGPDSNPRSIRNFPLQSNGAEMLRLSCIFATEAGIEVCAPVHDAILIAAPLDRIRADVEVAEQLMQKASELVLPGFPLRTSAALVEYPDRYTDPRGKGFWREVWSLIQQASRCPGG